MDNPDDTAMTFLDLEGRSTGPIPLKQFVERVDQLTGGKGKRHLFAIKGKDEAMSPEDGPVKIPEDHCFIDEEGNETDFLMAQGLRGMAVQLINRHETRFSHLAAAQFCVLWKRSGGEKAGKATLGQTQRAGGLVRFFAETEFVIWLAADHLRTLEVTRQQLEALLFHELCHIAWDPQRGRRRLVGHDFQGFLTEVKEYGAWISDLEAAAKVMQQLPLFRKKAEG